MGKQSPVLSTQMRYARHGGGEDLRVFGLGCRAIPPLNTYFLRVRVLEHLFSVLNAIYTAPYGRVAHVRFTCLAMCGTVGFLCILGICSKVEVSISCPVLVEKPGTTSVRLLLFLPLDIATHCREFPARRYVKHAGYRVPLAI